MCLQLIKGSYLRNIDYHLRGMGVVLINQRGRCSDIHLALPHADWQFFMAVSGRTGLRSESTFCCLFPVGRPGSHCGCDHVWLAEALDLIVYSLRNIINNESMVGHLEWNAVSKICLIRSLWNTFRSTARLRMHAHTYVNVDMRTHAHIHTTHLRTLTHAHTHICVHACMQTCTYMRARVLIHSSHLYLGTPM